MKSNTRQYFKIETLTPVHIGTGNEWMHKFEYEKIEKKKEIAVLSPEKILAAIGNDNIQNWISALGNNQSILTSLPLLGYQYKLEPLNVAERVIPDISVIDNNNQNIKKNIKQQMRTGNGIPIIPGSSLKGAIRTAIFAQAVYENRVNHQLPQNLNLRHEGFTNGLFQSGSTITSNIMKVVQVGDCIMPETVIDSSRSINNISRTGRNVPNSNAAISTKYDTLLECIKKNTEGIGFITINDILINCNKGKGKLNEAIFGLADFKDFSVRSLFNLINKHTLRILTTEINRGESQSGTDAWNNYTNAIINLKNRVSNLLKENSESCILPIGWGIGFRFMTGDWAEKRLAPAQFVSLANSVSKNDRYTLGYELTKTRRVTGSTNEPWGFVKLTLVRDEQAKDSIEKIEKRISGELDKSRKYKPLSQEELKKRNDDELLAKKAALVQEPFLGKLTIGAILDFKVTLDDGSVNKEGCVIIGQLNTIQKFKVRYPAAKTGDLLLVKVTEIRNGVVTRGEVINRKPLPDLN